ncbi:uncharacterized protein LOC124933579 [Impatiens glandulifera]|uniref:uncharacterized protein LOC124933579 n=1 Tax=Impatiens glandulifera TaxID=253017 RepID=UPI001FB12E2A|nr:uncharacterized protein LOC124933579 [Impatiens glandulifera]XP_047329956.1 uncharacterized protein LOC124933579 [Impatiens glandulifera]
MEKGVDAIIESSAVKDSFQKPPVDKLIEAPKSSLVLIPETPIKDSEAEEMGKSKLDLKLISSQVAVCDDGSNSHTPKEAVFDPFVKGSEHLEEDSHGLISRRLDFELLGGSGKCDDDADPEKESWTSVLDCDGDGDDEEDEDDENLLSENLLDDIVVSVQADDIVVSVQADDIVSAAAAAEDDENLLSENLLDDIVSVAAAEDDDYDEDFDYELLYADGFRSPTITISVAETCPAAPRKPAKTKKTRRRTYKINEFNLCCRKLQF